MSDQTWAVIIGAGVVAVLRVIDFFFPKGRWYNWGGKTSKEKDESIEREDAELDATTDVKRRRVDRDSDTVRRARDKKRHEEEEDD